MANKLYTMNWEELELKEAKLKAKNNHMPLSSLIKNKILNDESERSEATKKLMRSVND